MWSIKQTTLPQILVINPGSTSTKVALFNGQHLIASQTIAHPDELMKSFPTIWEQFDFRLQVAITFLQKHTVKELDAVVGRGGLLKPVPRGVFEVNDTMMNDARRGVQGEHIANLGCVLAKHVAKMFHCRAFVVDPVSVDEFEPEARLSGHPLIERRALAHVLNLRAAAIWAAQKQNVQVDQVNFVVVHMGGGISVAAMLKGRIIDVNDASCAGPFSPERSGSLPLLPLIDLCFSGRYTQAQMKKMVMGEGGVKAYLGTADIAQVEKMIQNGNGSAKLVFDAMVYQIAKEIGAMATVVSGKISAIVLTGGLAHSPSIIQELKKRISFIAPVITLPGELEMEAMALGAQRVLMGEEFAKDYR